MNSCDGAIFDETRTYRHILWRGGTNPMPVIMCNPSDGDEEENDRTLESLLRIAKFHGFDGLRVANCSDLISKDPEILKTHPKPVSEVNKAYILEVARFGPWVLVAWGNNGLINGRADEVLELLRSEGIMMKCLKISKLGQPEHPLYKKASTPLMEFR